MRWRACRLAQRIVAPEEGQVQSSSAELAQNAQFVFEGTIRKLGAATLKSVPISNRTAVVHVDGILQGPRSLANYLGQDITVELAGHRKVKEGQQALFYTNAWLFGESIAVQSIGQEPVGRTPHVLAGGAAGTAAPHENLAARELQKRVAE